MAPARAVGGKLRIVQVPYSYYPDLAGGTEVYVTALAQALIAAGAAVVIAAPGAQASSSTHASLPVRRFQSGPTVDLRELYGAGDPVAARHFGELLDQERPDLVHLSAFTSAVSLLVVREAKRRGLPVVLTYHTPTVSCQRGTLMRWGTEICDGAVEVARCAACTLHEHGAPRPLAALAGRIPPRVGELAGNLGLTGGTWTALQMSELTRLRRASLRSLLGLVDRIVVLCEWSREVLLRNGAPAENLVLSRHGVPEQVRRAETPALPPVAPPLRLAFFGRLHPSKGIDVLIRAFKRLPGRPIELDVYGVSQGAASREHEDWLRVLTAGDRRIEFRPAVASNVVVETMRAYHAVVVPSQWLETGPLVVLEAFAAGLPVIGSDLGGIAELIRPGLDGLVVPAGSDRAWRDVLDRLVAEPELLEQLRAGVRSPRSAALVAQDMLAIYRDLLSETNRQPSNAAEPLGATRSGLP